MSSPFDAFVERLPEERRGGASTAAVESALVAALDEARRAHPELDAPDEVLAAWIASRLPEGKPLVEALSAMRPADLRLACACARGDERAIATFESLYFGEVDVAYARVRTTATKDEAKQALRRRLFVGTEDEPAKIAQYGGTGDLRNWFRVAAMRTLLNFATRGPKEDALDDEAMAALPGGDEDPELAHLRKRYREEFRQAFAAAIAALSRRDRALLRYALVDGLTVDAISAIYDVHRATAARWVAKARETLLDELRGALRAKLRVGDDELQSILRLVQSGFDVTLSRYLVKTSD